MGTVELTGFEMMATKASGQLSATPAAREATMLALILKRSSLVMPGFLGTPAGMTTRSQPCHRDGGRNRGEKGEGRRQGSSREKKSAGVVAPCGGFSVPWASPELGVSLEGPHGGKRVDVGQVCHDPLRPLHVVQVELANQGSSSSTAKTGADRSPRTPRGPRLGTRPSSPSP